MKKHFISLPQRENSLRQPLFPIGTEGFLLRESYHLRWRWPASHLSGLRRSRCPAKRSGRAKPRTQIPDRSPDPLEAPSSPRGRKNYDRKVIQHEKRYQIQHAHGVRRPGEDQGAGGKGPYVHERLCHRLLSRQTDRGCR